MEEMRTIYFVLSVGKRLVKVGCTGNLAQRRKQLAAQYPDELLVLLGSLVAPPAVEQAILSRTDFGSRYHGRKREWVVFTKDFAILIERITGPEQSTLVAELLVEYNHRARIVRHFVETNRKRKTFCGRRLLDTMDTTTSPESATCAHCRKALSRI